MACDGNCIELYGEHLGEVHHVLVEYKEFNGIKPFTFDYCENAIKEDESRGFKVTIINEFEQQRLLKVSET